MAVNLGLFNRYDTRVAGQRADEDAAMDITDPTYTQQYMNTQFNRGREDLGMGPGGYNRSWVPTFEAGDKFANPQAMGTDWAQPGRDFQTSQPMSLQALNDAAPITPPVVQPKGVSGPQPLSQRPLPPLQQPTPAPTGSTTPGPTPDMKGQLQTVPRPWTPNLPARNPLPSGSLLSLQQLVGGY